MWNIPELCRDAGLHTKKGLGFVDTFTEGTGYTSVFAAAEAMLSYGSWLDITVFPLLISRPLGNNEFLDIH